MKFALVFLFHGLLFFSFGQAKLEFELKNYEYGQIVLYSDANRSFEFTNTGNEALIISRISTGDGGSMCTYPREPIAPGGKGIIKFHYDTKRIGPFTKTITVQYNGRQYDSKNIIRIKGEVIYPATNVSMEKEVLDIGTILYGELDSISVILQNSGEFPLHITSLYYPTIYSEIDVFYVRVKPLEIKYNSAGVPQDFYEPGQQIKLSFAIRNVMGNVCYFERRLGFRYNSYDTLWVKIKGTFSGGPDKAKTIEQNTIFEYEDNKLVKKTIFSTIGSLYQIHHYDKSNCVHIEKYEASGLKWQEEYYRYGELIEKKNYQKKQ